MFLNPLNEITLQLMFIFKLQLFDQVLAEFTLFPVFFRAFITTDMDVLRRKQGDDFIQDISQELKGSFRRNEYIVEHALNELHDGKHLQLGIVVQGGVTTAILNAVVAEELPGPGSVFLQLDLRFRAPVRPGDVITGTVEVTSARADKPITFLDVRVTRDDGVVAVDGSAVCYTEPLG